MKKLAKIEKSKNCELYLYFNDLNLPTYKYIANVVLSEPSSRLDQTNAKNMDNLHLQYIGSGPAAVLVELPGGVWEGAFKRSVSSSFSSSQLLHLGEAEVGHDHPISARQVFLAVESVLSSLSSCTFTSYRVFFND